jgi:gas vesicle protein
MPEEHDSHLMEGLLIGGLIGAAIGVLFAPFSGDQSRAVIKEKLKDFDLDEMIGRFSEAFEEAKKEAGRVANDLDDLTEGEDL